jgi:uncharacterized protein YndB with AHSA1/START domain
VAQRVDTASRWIHAFPSAIFDAFTRPDALEAWLPPGDMTGTMLRFEFRVGGGYRLRLTYRDPHDGRGKTSDAADEVEARWVDVEPDRRLVQEVDFASDDPAFHGTMRMTWTLRPEGTRTLVTVRAEDVPDGIRPGDHRAGLEASLGNLARFVEAR